VLKKKNLELSTHHADRLLYMKMIIKCSDLKHPSLKRDAHLKWSAMVNEEFIQQAFKEDELGLPHRCPTTREPVAVAKSQAGFIRFLVLPTFRRFCEHVGGEFANFLVNRLKAQISFWNEARRRAEFRRGGRTVMVMNRLRKMSSRNVKVPSTVMEEEQSGAGGSDGVGGGASVSGHSRAYNKSASVPDAPSRESAPLLPPSERADGRENAPSPLRSETVMSDPGDPAVAGREIDQRSMVDRTLSAPHSLTHKDASIGRE
jgi:hypothetical protein